MWLVLLFIEHVVSKGCNAVTMVMPASPDWCSNSKCSWKAVGTARAAGHGQCSSMVNRELPGLEMLPQQDHKQKGEVCLHIFILKCSFLKIKLINSKLILNQSANRWELWIQNRFLSFFQLAIRHFESVFLNYDVSKNLWFFKTKLSGSKIYRLT